MTDTKRVDELEVGDIVIFPGCKGMDTISKIEKITDWCYEIFSEGISNSSKYAGYKEVTHLGKKEKKMMIIKSDEVQSTKKKLEKLHKLLDAADQQANTQEYDKEYRERCFYNIYDAFWKIARQIGISRDDYDGYDDYEDIMRYYLSRFEDSNPDWLLDVLEEIEEE